jgi:hypothetical protein
MYEVFLNLFSSNFKTIKSSFLFIIKNKFLILSILSLLTVGLIKFDDIWQTLYEPQDLIQARKYMDKLMDLSKDDDRSCTEKAQRARREIKWVSGALHGILETHVHDKAYKALDLGYNRATGMYNIPFCYDKKHPE